jgi:hypothetical protein
MNIVIANYSGNIGKSTLVRHLLSPNLPDHKIVSVESINLDGLAPDTLTTTGKRSGKSIDDLILNRETIFDVGGSNVEDFMTQLGMREGAHEDIDLFLVPTTSDRKIMGDTINIITDLADLGVSSGKIRLIFNRVDSSESELLEEIFKPIYDFYRDRSLFMLSEHWTIFNSEMFELTRNMKDPDGNPLTVYDLASDTTDYKRLIRETQDPDLKTQYARRLAASRLAKSAKTNLDSVFAELTSTSIQGEKE